MGHNESNTMRKTHRSKCLKKSKKHNKTKQTKKQKQNKTKQNLERAYTSGLTAELNALEQKEANTPKKE